MGLDEQKIRAMIKEEIRLSNSSLRFQQTGIPRHIHNGIDSPPVFQQTVTYVGLSSDATGTYAFPIGWTEEQLAAGRYKIRHNLNSQNYIVNVTPWDVSGTNFIPTVVFDDDYPNSFNVYIVNTTPSYVNANYMFSLTQTDNKSITPPRYRDAEDI